MLDAAVIGFFGFLAKEAGGQFPVLPMVFDALAANAFLRAGISAVAVLEVFLFLAFHKITKCTGQDSNLRRH